MRTSSRAWTEVATGVQARSRGRWLTRTVAPILRRYAVMLLLVAVAVMVLFPRFWPADNQPCFGCHEPPLRLENSPRDLLDLIF